MRRTYFAAAAAFEDPRRFLPLSVGEKRSRAARGKVIVQIEEEGAKSRAWRGGRTWGKPNKYPCSDCVTLSI